LQHQHKAAELQGRRALQAGGAGRDIGKLLRSMHGGHLHPQQVVPGRGTDEVGRGMLRPTLQANLQALQGLGHPLAVQCGVDGAAQADQIGAAQGG
jgi:hypothetical protein